MKQIPHKSETEKEVNQDTLAQDLALSPSPGSARVQDSYKGERFRCTVQKCPQEERMYSNSFNIRRHWALSHKKQVKHFRCPEKGCSTTFRSLADGHKHLRNQHKRSWDEAGQLFFDHDLIANTTYVSPKEKTSHPLRDFSPKGRAPRPWTATQFGPQEVTPLVQCRVKSVVHQPTVKHSYSLDSSCDEAPGLSKI